MDVSGYDDSKYVDGLDETYKSVIVDEHNQGKKFNHYLNTYNIHSIDSNKNKNDAFVEHWIDYKGDTVTVPNAPSNDSILLNVKYFYDNIDEYTQMYNIYSKTSNAKKPADVSHLLIKAESIELQGKQIIDAIGKSKNSNDPSTEEILNMVNTISNSINKVDIRHNRNIAEFAETSNLIVVSSYYHYIVFLFLGTLIIGCTFNAITRPDNAYINPISIVLSITLVYLISKHFE